MRKKTMQLREKPLVYPRYPKTQTLGVKVGKHTNDACFQLAPVKSVFPFEFCYSALTNGANLDS